MKKYPWGQKVSELLKKHDLRFEIVEEIPHEQMGSSPGDICWTGERLLAAKARAFLKEKRLTRLAEHIAVQRKGGD